ncbi:MAG: hypothetical protein DWQ20_05780, partial [Actinobacteria bacterium]
MVRVRPLVLLIALVVAVAACTNEGTTTTTSAGGTTTTSSTLPGETTTTTAPPLDLTELPGTETLPQEVRDELIELVQLTQQVRELNFLEAPMISVVSDAELEARVREQFEEQVDDLPVDEALYELLGLL